MSHDRRRHYTVTFIPEDANPHPLDENIDVEVVFEDGTKYVATFFTLENIQALFQKNRKTGECCSGLYFWASDLILVQRLTLENVQRTVADLMEQGEFETAFGGPFPGD